MTRLLCLTLLLSTFAVAQSGSSGGVRTQGNVAANDCTKFVSKTVIASAGAACGSGSGTVSSVSFTGGLISVATATTTPALTVAGTSGGIPYFSAANTWASSAALAATGLVIGGGAGVTPATSTALTFSTPTLTIGLAGTSSGIIALAGSTSGTATITAPATAGTTTNPVVFSNVIQGADGSAAAPSFRVLSDASGFYRPQASRLGFSIGGSAKLSLTSTGSWQTITGGGYSWSNSSTDPNTSTDTGFVRDSAGVVDLGTGAAADKTGTLLLTTLTATGVVTGARYKTSTVCTSAASPAVCGANSAGFSAIPVGATQTLVVNTTAVTANSQIFTSLDATLGTPLGITCNSNTTTLGNLASVTARTAGTSFTVTLNTTSATNQPCFSWFIVN